MIKLNITNDVWNIFFTAYFGNDDMRTNFQKFVICRFMAHPEVTQTSQDLINVFKQFCKAHPNDYSRRLHQLYMAKDSDPKKAEIWAAFRKLKNKYENSKTDRWRCIYCR